MSDIDRALRHWTEVHGAGPFFYVESVALDWFVCGESEVAPELSIALGNSGPLQIELICQRDDTPSMYTQFLAEFGEGLQHVAYWSTDYQRDHDRLCSADMTVGQAGQIGGPDGRFAYFESPGLAGSVLELSDISGSKGKFFEHIRKASENWDGSRPVRPVS